MARNDGPQWKLVLGSEPSSSVSVRVGDEVSLAGENASLLNLTKLLDENRPEQNHCFLRMNGVPMSDCQVWQEFENAREEERMKRIWTAYMERIRSRKHKEEMCTRQYQHTNPTSSDGSTSSEDGSSCDDSTSWEDESSFKETPSDSDEFTCADDTMCVHQDDRATLLINGAVTEVFVSQDDAKNVRLTMERIQGLPGILTCGPERACVITDGNSERVCYALTMTPSCTTLTMSTARPHHFAQYARILANVAQERQLNHNFISLDCLCVDPAGNCFISDWGSATKINTPLPSGSGKRYFVPCCRMSGTGHGKRRLSSLRLDLESLYLVAISCSLKRVPWTRPYAPSVRCECERWCALGRGSFNNCTMPKGEWDYLADLSDV